MNVKATGDSGPVLQSLTGIKGVVCGAN